MLISPAAIPGAKSLANVYQIGLVVDNNDPEKLERIRVRLHLHHRDVEDKDLPWAIPDSNNSPQGNTSAQQGGINIPVVGAKVLVRFQDDSVYNPVYYASPMTMDLKVQELLSEDYPHVYAWIDRSGNLFLTNTERDHTRYVHVSGAMLAFDGKGHTLARVADKQVGPNATSIYPLGLTLEVWGPVRIFCRDNAEVHAGDNAFIRAGNNAQVHAQSNVNVAARRIDLNSNGPTAPTPTPEPPPRTRPEQVDVSGRTEY